MHIYLSILLQILAQHIKAVLPGLRARISTSLVSVAKEHASYGEITESKVCVNTKYAAHMFSLFCKRSGIFSTLAVIMQCIIYKC